MTTLYRSLLLATLIVLSPLAASAQTLQPFVIEDTEGDTLLQVSPNGTLAPAFGLRFPDGTVQTSAASGALNTWLLGGNAGLTGDQFIGTTDAAPFQIRTNNVPRITVSNTEAAFANNINVNGDGIFNDDLSVADALAVNGIVRVGSGNVFSENPASFAQVINVTGSSSAITFDNGSSITAWSVGRTTGNGLSFFRSNVEQGRFRAFSNASSLEMLGPNSRVGITLVAFDNVGQVTADDFIERSDRRLKENIADLGYGLDEVLRLRPVTYNLIATNDEAMPKEIGFIAQEVDEVLPEIVRWPHAEEESQMLGLDYTDIIPVLVRAIQQQQAEIEALKQALGQQ